MKDDALAIYSEFLDGRELSDAESGALRAWILDCDEHAAKVVEFALLHGAITDRLMLRRLLDDLAVNRRAAMITPAMLVEAIEDIESSSPRVTPLPPPVAPEPESSAPWEYLAAPIAAVAALLVLGAWLIWQDFGVDLPPVADASTSQPVATLPPVVPKPPKIVAKFGTSFGAVWANRVPPGRDQEFVQGERLQLVSGSLYLEMISGASVVVEGPSDLILRDEAAIDLASGKVAVRINGAADSFVVDTPKMHVVDLGTEFGVECGLDQQERVMVFDGSVALADLTSSSKSVDSFAVDADAFCLAAGSEVNVNAKSRLDASHMIAEPLTNDRYFLRPDEIEVRQQALAGSRDAQLLAEHYERMRINGLLAYQPFDSPSAGQRYAIGMGSQGAVSQAEIGFFGDAGHGAIDVQNGPAFIWLDSSQGSRIARAKLVKPNGLIGESNRELWLTWTAQRIRSQANSTGSAGLSLMFGDRSDVDEPIFFGRGFGETEELCVQSAWGGGPPPLGQRVDVHVDLDLNSSGIQPRMVNDEPHQWLARIEFRDGADRVSVWLDSELKSVDLDSPHAIMDVADIEFERLRLAVNRDDETWRFGNFAAAVKLTALQKLEDVGAFQIDE